MNSNKHNEQWWRGAVIYQIYPRSYQDSNGDGIGDLPGITRRLPHVAALGAEAIWISPFFTSPMADFGYDVSDYCDVDPMFGTLADFDALIARAHELGLKVLIDLVLSHTSDQHPWFAESRASRDNARADWYVWADAKADGTPPSNWLSLFGGSAWQWDARRQQYYLHNFLASQPDLNFHCPAVQDALLDVARFWLERGVDGFRLDTVNFYTHDALLRDNPPQPAGEFAAGVPRNNPYAFQRHLYDKTQPENLLFLNRLRALCDQFDDRVAIGEIGDDRQYPTLADYTRGDDRLHMAYVFTLLTEACAPAYLHAVLADYLAQAGDAYVCWSLGNHDVPRVVSRWAELGGSAEQRARLCAAFLLALPGALCLYQGEELGLPEAEVPYELLQDPYGKVLWPEYKGRDGCRTPLPWSDETDGGFGSAIPWLPVSAEQLPLAVERQQHDTASTLAFWRHFIGWRATQPALRYGRMRLLDAHQQIVGFERHYRGETLACLFNFSARPATLPLAGHGQLLDGSGLAATLEAGELTLPPLSAAFVRLTAGEA
ncbi:alpha-glucosidase family protein [Pseudogulbenkiania subflava]|uniref:Alpha-glucosidase n=1 Tax=Pseudogulbenkiania subflava DSM 22618 TaxID=1123014 RepID=A0A1Y6CES6_9NEIS|nr:alpha-glucosidase family protein [Pseudogulbenkiania subflava]SMF51518.1 alpha-glucosidase [Pseudogulbenkiania subflava DSM 22618]